MELQSRFGKVYSNQDEEITHYEQWQVNRRIIQEHNMDASTGQHSYTLEENVLSDLVCCRAHQTFVITLL